MSSRILQLQLKKKMVGELLYIFNRHNHKPISVTNVILLKYLVPTGTYNSTLSFFCIIETEQFYVNKPWTCLVYVFPFNNSCFIQFYRHMLLNVNRFDHGSFVS